MEVCKSTWEEGLKRVGECYEGFGKNFDDLLAKHSIETVTTYGTRRSRKIGVSSRTNEASLAEEKENHKTMVNHLSTDLSIYCKARNFGRI